MKGGGTVTDTPTPENSNSVFRYAASVTGKSLRQIRDTVARECPEFSDSEYLDENLRALWGELQPESRALVLVIAEHIADRASDRD